MKVNLKVEIPIRGNLNPEELKWFKDNLKVHFDDICYELEEMYAVEYDVYVGPPRIKLGK